VTSRSRMITGSRRHSPTQRAAQLAAEEDLGIFERVSGLGEATDEGAR
jgi:hypothetical protein